ncbi:MAG TPA: ABC transporter substrate-binding protein [Methylomirabilota bacterium]|nr:ABC transporter substrate-binding protein [Methylomirabilota bacterium]
MSDRRESLSRREFVCGLALAGTAGLHGLRPEPVAAEPPPETARLRLIKIPSVCQAPQYVAGELLQAEGFTDVQYVQKAGALGITEALASGEADINNHFVAPSIIRVEAGDPIVILGGLHIGCFELFGTDRVRTIRDLKGKTVAVLEIGSAQHVFLSTMAAHVGLDPRRDINWVTHRPAESMRLFAEGKVDAFLGFPPEPQELRARKIGHVVVNSTRDRPWSQYFCCMMVGNREFVRKHPVATKRALRAILKANSLCALEPERAARYLVDKGFTQRVDYALQALKNIPYGQWREYDPEDTVRFYALRLHEAGMIKLSPPKIIAQGTDWRFLNELKKELKG